MARWWSVVALVAVVAASAGVAQTGFGHSLLQKAGLTAAPAPYTALAFAQPQSLPTQLPSRHTTTNVSFSIRNSSGRARSYQWSILLVRNGHGHRTAAGQAQVSPGSGTIVTEAVPISCVGGQVQVVVSLASPAESIDYRASCWTRGGGSG